MAKIYNKFAVSLQFFKPSMGKLQQMEFIPNSHEENWLTEDKNRL